MSGRGCDVQVFSRANSTGHVSRLKSFLSFWWQESSRWYLSVKTTKEHPPFCYFDRKRGSVCTRLQKKKKKSWNFSCVCVPAHTFIKPIRSGFAKSSIKHNTSQCALNCVEYNSDNQLFRTVVTLVLVYRPSLWQDTVSYLWKERVNYRKWRLFLNIWGLLGWHQL